MKRYIIIIFSILIIVAIALGAYWFFVVRNASSAPATGTGETGTLPTTGTQTGTGETTGNTSGTLPNGGAPGTTGVATQFGVVSNEPVLDYFVDAQNNTTVVEPDGKIATIANGQATFLSSTTFVGVLGASFSYDGAKVLVSTGDPINPQTSIFDIATNAWLVLAPGIISPVWSPSDHRVAYLTVGANGTETLATITITKTASKPTALISLHAQDLSAVWPSTNNIVLFDKPSALANGSALLYNAQNKTLAPIALETPGFSALWSGAATNASTTPFGLAFSANTPRVGGQLRLVGASGNTIQNMNFLTMPSKCLFNREASTTATTPGTPYLALYCAVPQDQDGFGSAWLPDTYNEMALFTVDTFYRVHTDTGAVDTILSPAQSVDATDLRLFNRILFFVNRYDQKLYAISLGS